MKKFVFIVGARPNFMKLYPIYKKFIYRNERVTVIHTGQHNDTNMSDVFVKEFNIDNIVNLNIGYSSPNEQLAKILLECQKILSEIKPDLVFVFGDVTSTLGGALAANKLNIPIAHIESGNRSFDKTMPEEINRILVDNLSKYLFISEQNGYKNLINEGITEHLYYVGNPMIDTLIAFKPKFIETDFYKSFNLEPYTYIVLTIHRVSNTSDLSKLHALLKELKKYKIIFPIHPRIKNEFDEYDNIITTSPLGYLEFMNIVYHSGMVLTDSGGIQEETTALGIPCVTLRPNTERPITCTHGTNCLINITEIIRIKDHVNNNFATRSKCNILYWDGHSADRIYDIVKTIRLE